MKRSSINVPRFGSGICFSRLYKLADSLDLNIEELGKSSIVITGTNGKGSVSTILSELLHCKYDRVGLFTSPHVYEFNERISINGKYIADESLISLEREVLAAASKLSDCENSQVFGEFELWFIVACLHFKRSGVQFSVFEGGIGGRYDPTRMLRANKAVITSIDLEHTDLLGETEELIFFDKADVARSGGVLILSNSIRRISDRIAGYLKVRSISHLFADDFVSEPKPLGSDWFISLTKSQIQLNFRPRLIGYHQLENFQTAMAAFLEIINHNFSAENKDCYERALGNAFLPGRFEVISNDPLFIIDFGHTPAALQISARYIHDFELNQGATLLLGISKKRNISEIINEIAPLFNNVIIGPSYNGHNPIDIKAAYEKINPEAAIKCHSDFSNAYQEAISSGSNVIALGGYFWGAALRAEHLFGRGADVEF
ncbi:MAG: hypothetical protein JJU18_12060 [Oceanicaulis sp.]|nr:hypothetical protein [Oceanicaulis sp.]